MKTILLILLIFGLSFAEPCQDYTCDSLVVRAILDSNGLYNVTVSSVSKVTPYYPEKRITHLELIGEGPYPTIPTKLKFLPDAIGNLSELTELNLFLNDLADLPSSIGKLTNLVSLDVGYNNLTDIPSTFFSLENISHLELSYNKINYLPIEIINFKPRSDIYIGYNELCNLDEVIKEWLNRNSLSHYYNYYSGHPGIGNTMPVAWSRTQRCESIYRVYMPDSGDITDGWNPIVLIECNGDTAENVRSITVYNIVTDSFEVFDSTIIGSHIPVRGYINRGHGSSMGNVFDINSFIVYEIDVDCNTGLTENFGNASEMAINVFPNPFNPVTYITCTLKPNEKGTINIYDIRGKLMFKKEVVKKDKVKWNAQGFSSGIYYFKLTVGNKTYVKKGILLR